MKRTWLSQSLEIGIVLSAVAVVPSFAMAEAKIGATLEEIIELAKQEPTVTLATTWQGEIIDYAKNGFKEKYGLELEFLDARQIESRERIFNEALAGVNEVDLVNVSGELLDQFTKADLVYQVDYATLFPNIDKGSIRPDGHYLATGWNQFVLAYNPKMVSEEEAPKDWPDCLDPKWKGKVAVYTRPLTFIQQYFQWGEEKSIEYHKALKAQEPIWTSDVNSTVSQLAAGEFPIVCGIQYHAIKYILHEDPSAPVAWVVPKVFPYMLGEALAVMKGSDSPNAAILLAAYLATDGAHGYDLFGRSNPIVEGTDAWKYSHEAGATPYWSGWETSGDVQAAASKAIVEAWGFPKGK